MKGVEAGSVAFVGLVALAAGAVVGANTPSEREAAQVKGSARSEAIATIERLGGTYARKLNGSPDFGALVTRLGYDERAYYDVLSVNLGPVAGAKPIGDADLAALAEHLALFIELKVLDLRGNSVSDDGLAALPPLPNLSVIRLSGAGITDGIADVVARFPALSDLELEDTAVTDAGAAKIQHLLPGCKVSR